MLPVDGRVIMITGANRGIGLAISRALAEAGYRLSLGARDTGSLNAAALPGDAITHQWDATEPASSAAWVEATLAHYGQLDGVVLNAGVFFSADIEHGSEADMDQMWEVNFKGPMRLLRASLPALRASGHGRVINIASLAGKRLLSEASLGYSASKFAALALTHAVRRNGWDSGLRATAICPGLVDTDMVSQVSTPTDEFKILPEDIAATAAYALALSASASVAEILVNSRLEASF